MQKIRLKNKPFCNDLHFFLFGVVLLLLSLNYSFFYIVLVGYLFFIFKKTKYFFPLIGVLIIVFISFNLANFNFKPQNSGTYEDYYEVVEVNKRNIILKNKTKCIVYAENMELKPGDRIYAKLKIDNLSKASFAGDFDAYAYYKALGITNRGRLIEYEIIESRWTLSRFRYTILNYYESHLKEKSFTYLKALFFGKSDFEENVSEAYSSLYLTHILVISGLHIQFLYSTLLFLFQKFFRIRGEKMALLIIGGYVLFIGIPVSCLRAFLFLLLKHWNQKDKIQYTQLDILSITYISMVVFFPLKALQTGFILSFLISFILIFIEEFQPSKSKFKRRMFTSMICILVILPFLINQSHKLSILGILISFILGYGLGKLILPITLCLLVFPNSFFENFFFILDDLLVKISDYTFSIRVPHLSMFLIILYYCLLVYILVCYAKGIKKYTIFYFILFFLLVLSLRILNRYYKVTFIDVGQGDSILIELPHDQGNMLIDSYNNIDFLKSIGIRKIDYVVLTHFDNDHMGSMSEVLEAFNVKEIIYSKYENPKKIQDFKVKKTAVSSGDCFSLGECQFKVLGPIKDYEDSNSNSVVLSMAIKKYRFLFTGDMTTKEEMDLIQKYKESLKCDVLKVGHHGSMTSSSDEFLRTCMPRYSIISVSENNLYGLPSEEVVRKLEAISQVYMTKTFGNIEIRINNSLKITSYRSG